MDSQVPAAGEVRFMTITDRQFERIRVFVGKIRQPTIPSPSQLGRNPQPGVRDRRATSERGNIKHQPNPRPGLRIDRRLTARPDKPAPTPVAPTRTRGANATGSRRSRPGCLDPPRTRTGTSRGTSRTRSASRPHLPPTAPPGLETPPSPRPNRPKPAASPIPTTIHPPPTPSAYTPNRPESVNDTTS